MKNKGNYKAILAYLFFIGLIIAYILNMDEKDKFVTFHIKNMFGLVLISIFPITFVNDPTFYSTGKVIFTLLIILWSYSLVMAITGKMKGIPYLSDFFQKWFRFLN
ncbi:MAG: hypothetical protein L3J09_01940 [Flavobacteriaceae bacterium]|nr:hypothetical protein [Flavobacteriaceae bacterium]